MAKKKSVETKAPTGSTQQPLDGAPILNEPSSSAQKEPEATPEITDVVNGVADLSMTDKERGELDRQTKTREEIKAEREAKKANKANKKVNSTTKTVQPPTPKTQQQASQITNVSSSEATASQVNKVKKEENVTEKQLSPEPKSAIKKDTTKGNREVQFDLNTIVLRTPSEETLEVPKIFTYTEPLPTMHVHPTFLTLAAKCEREQIVNIDDLCEEFLLAFQKFIRDWGEERLRNSGAESISLGVDLDLAIRPQLGYLTEDGRWPLPYALGNLVRQMKKEIKRLGEPCKHAHTKEDGTVTAELPGGCDKLEDLEEWLEDTRYSCFELATNAISSHLLRKKTFSKKVVTFDWCRVVNQILIDACNSPDQDLQHVVVLDQQVNGRGVRHIDSLLEHDVKLDYGDLRGLSTAIYKCSMVLVGCSAVLSNGCVAAPKGSLSIALAAQANNVPFLVCAQTFKFVDKVQSYGRMALLGRENMELVPSSLVTAIVTDIRIVPPSSAPAILKAKALESQDNLGS